MNKLKKEGIKMNKEILIFGHKNPDTDTICSAIVKQILNERYMQSSKIRKCK